MKPIIVSTIDRQLIISTLRTAARDTRREGNGRATREEIDTKHREANYLEALADKIAKQ